MSASAPSAPLISADAILDMMSQLATALPQDQRADIFQFLADSHNAATTPPPYAGEAPSSSDQHSSQVSLPHHDDPRLSSSHEYDYLRPDITRLDEFIPEEFHSPPDFLSGSFQVPPHGFQEPSPFNLPSHFAQHGLSSQAPLPTQVQPVFTRDFQVQPGAVQFQRLSTNSLPSLVSGHATRSAPSTHQSELFTPLLSRQPQSIQPPTTISAPSSASSYAYPTSQQESTFLSQHTAQQQPAFLSQQTTSHQQPVDQTTGHPLPVDIPQQSFQSSSSSIRSSTTRRFYRPHQSPRPNRSAQPTSNTESTASFYTQAEIPRAQPTIYYAVRRGRIPGVYPLWEQAATQLSGYPHPMSHPFRSRLFAQAYVHAPTHTEALEFATRYSHLPSTTSPPNQVRQEVDNRGRISPTFSIVSQPIDCSTRPPPVHSVHIPGRSFRPTEQTPATSTQAGSHVLGQGTALRPPVFPVQQNTMPTTSQHLPPMSVQAPSLGTSAVADRQYALMEKLLLAQLTPTAESNPLPPFDGSADLFVNWFHDVQIRLKGSNYWNPLADLKTTPPNLEDLSRTLYLALLQCLPPDLRAEWQAKKSLLYLGPELLTALDEHYEPATPQQLASLYTSWLTLSQPRDETVTKFSFRLQRLASRLEKNGQVVGETIQIVKFLHGLDPTRFHSIQEAFHTGSRKIHAESYERLVTDVHNFSNLPGTVALAQAAAARAKGLTPPTNNPPDNSTAPLSTKQIEELFKKFSCPLHRSNTHSLQDCHAIKSRFTPFTIKESPTGVIRSPTPRSTHAPQGGTGTARKNPGPNPVAAATWVSPPSGDNSPSPLASLSANPSLPTNYTDNSSPVPAPPAPPTHAVAETPLSQRVGDCTATPPPVVVPNIQEPIDPTITDGDEDGNSVDGSDSSFTPLHTHGGSAFVATLCSILEDNVGKLSATAYAALVRSVLAIIDSGASDHMFPDRAAFITFTPLTGSYITIADDTQLEVAGRGTVQFRLANRLLRLCDVLYVPGLAGPLISLRRLRRLPGCGFFADNTGCSLVFPSFVIPIDDSREVALPYCSEPSSDTAIDFDEQSALRRLPSTSLGSGYAVNNRTPDAHRLVTPGPPPPDRQQVAHHPDPATRAPSPLPDTPPPPPFVSPVPAVRPCDTPNSAGPAVCKLTSHELHQYTGFRKFRDYSVFDQISTNLQVVNTGTPPLDLGSVASVPRGARGGSLPRSAAYLQDVYMDIGYGDGVAPQGYTHCLVLVDHFSRYTWVYGLKHLGGSAIADALLQFLIDAGGNPGTLHCDFDRRLIAGDARRFINDHKIRLHAAPSGRQSQNGLVERAWRTMVEMARGYLTDMQMPKRFWFWAIRHSSRVMNYLPALKNKVLTTPFELVHHSKPDYRTLFRLFSVGFFRHTVDGTRARTTFEAQTLTGIAVGRCTDSNAMEFYSPITQQLYVSADYRLDSQRTTASVFPTKTLQYDGGIQVGLYSNPQSGGPEPFPPHTEVYVAYDGVVVRGFVQAVPIPSADPTAPNVYTVRLSTGEFVECAQSDLRSSSDAIASLDSQQSDTQFRLLPPWITLNAKISLEIDGELIRGYLAFDTYHRWCFEQRAKNGKVLRFASLDDLPFTWESRVNEGSLVPGWQSTHSFLGRGFHVSARGCRAPCPSTLVKALHPTFCDRDIWLESYQEEYNNLLREDTFTIIDHAEYQRLYDKCGPALPTMCVLAVKKDADGTPQRAKSRIVVLGNLESTPWTKGDCFAPVVAQSAMRLLVSIAVEHKCILKQADAKNAFCQPTLPDEEVVVVRPPPACPISKPGTLWRLNKTLYGLRRSPRHWYELVKRVFAEMGLHPCAHSPCLFTGTPIPGQPPIYIAVDDMAYFSPSRQVETWFETTLQSKLRVDFMGAVEWFLGTYYEWQVDPVTGDVSVHLSQPSTIQSLLEKYQMSDCNPVATPYRSGFPIDAIPIPPDGYKPDPRMISDYQSLVGSLNWLSVSTRPELSTVVSLLSSHLHTATSAHFDSARYVLRFLKGTPTHGISFHTGGNSCLEAFLAFPPGTPPSSTVCYTDACWGPQDASAPTSADDSTLPCQPMDVTRSIGGHVVFRSGGPISWSAKRERRTSRSSCEAEIKATDEATKEIQFLRLVMADLKLADVDSPTQVYNDNRGCIDWSQTRSTKRLRHYNIRENAVREAIQHKEMILSHIMGKHNPADLFTKEHRDVMHFKALAACVISAREHGGC